MPSALDTFGTVKDIINTYLQDESFDIPELYRPHIQETLCAELEKHYQSLNENELNRIVEKTVKNTAGFIRTHLKYNFSSDRILISTERFIENQIQEQIKSLEKDLVSLRQKVFKIFNDFENPKGFFNWLRSFFISAKRQENTKKIFKAITICLAKSKLHDLSVVDTKDELLTEILNILDDPSKKFSRQVRNALKQIVRDNPGEYYNQRQLLQEAEIHTIELLEQNRSVEPPLGYDKKGTADILRSMKDLQAELQWLEQQDQDPEVQAAKERTQEVIRRSNADPATQAFLNISKQHLIDVNAHWQEPYPSGNSSNTESTTNKTEKKAKKTVRFFNNENADENHAVISEEKEVQVENTWEINSNGEPERKWRDPFTSEERQKLQQKAKDAATMDLPKSTLKI